VASQTLINLNVIDRAVDTVVLRPLVTMDKGEIIDISRKIGTESFAASMPEYCGVISVNPTTRAKLPRVEHEESKFDMAILDRAFSERRAQNIDEIVDELDADLSVPMVGEIAAGQVVIDIRHPDEQEANPLKLDGIDVRVIPFYSLNNQFAHLDSSLQYFLYCQKGVMSQLHAANLKDAGHLNVGVYRPEPRSACAIS
jgi:thiamine biosynthesis protein ThiI